ncbi:uncharacterized protein [Salminus brasiliensis]|uniref:uncharacterized protein n=1 Tax=Salminus brasiliensis TaxID=930266 RepID=UPI003B831A21
MSDMVQFPAVQTQGGQYMAVSKVRVKDTDWKAKKPLTCAVSNPAGSESTTMRGKSPPSVHLGEVGESIMCLIEDFYPNQLKIKWKEDNREVKGIDWQTIEDASGSFKALSVLKPNKTSKDTKYTSKFSLQINGPSAKELFLHNEATITCVVTGDNKNEVDGAVVKWTVGGSNRGSSGTDNVKQTTPPFTKTSSLTLDQSEWFSGSEVKCSTEKEKTPFSDTIKVKKGGKPSIVFYKPDKDVKDTHTVSLLCEVRSSGLGDVYVMWKMNNGQYMEGNSTVHINEKNTAVVLSYLTVSERDYNSAQFTCAVKDPNTVAGATPDQKTTSNKEPDPGLYLNCDKDIPEDDDFNSLWSTASSFIFLFLFTLIYSTVLSLSKCSSSTDGFLTFGCITSGFSPAESLKFSWTLGFGNTTDVVQFPPVQTQGGVYTAVSQARVKTTDWTAKNVLTCSVTHPAGSENTTVRAPPTVHVDEVGESIMCLIEDFYPNNLSVKWKEDNREVKGIDWQTIEYPPGSFKAVSLLEANKTSKDTKYTCEVTHASKVYKEHLASKATFSLKINSPSAKELFERSKATITCVVTGDNKKEVDGAIVAWTVGGSKRGSSGTDHVKQTTPPFTKTSSLTLDQSEWFSGSEVECSTEREKTPFSDTIKVKKGGKPSIVFYKPEKDVKDTETVSLLCEVSSSDLGDVYVMWKMNNGQYMEGSSTVHINEKNTAVVLSYLTVSGKEYNSAQFACAVKDPNMVAGATPEQKTTSMNKFSLKINPPSAKDLFVRNKATITCVVTGDNKNEVDGAIVSWTVGGSKHESSETDNVKQTTPPFTKTSSLTLDQSEWFSGSEVKCSTEREKTPFSDKIKVKKGGKPSIVLYKPDKDVKDNETVSLLCDVSSSDLGDVYVMWQMKNNPYMEGNSTVRINEKTVLSYLTVSGKDYNSAQFSCAVKDANMEKRATPDQKTTSKTELPASDPGLYINCDKDIPEEDDFNSLWSTASSFIFLFLFTLIYSTVLSLAKVKIF